MSQSLILNSGIVPTSVHSLSFWHKNHIMTLMVSDPGGLVSMYYTKMASFSLTETSSAPSARTLTKWLSFIFLHSRTSISLDIKFINTPQLLWLRYATPNSTPCFSSSFRSCSYLTRGSSSFAMK